MAGDELTREERVLRRVLLVLGAVLGLFVIHYVLEGVVGGAEFPFVANSAAKDSLFFILCMVGASDVRRFGWAVWVIVIGHVLLVGALLAALISGQGMSVAATLPPIFGLPVPEAHTYLLIWLAAAVTITSVVALCGHRALRSRYPLRYLSQLQHRTLSSLAEVLVMDKSAVVTPDEVANRVDDYLYGVEAKEKWKAKLALTALTFYPLIRLRPPYSFMSPLVRQRFIEKCFIADVAERRLPGFLRRPLQTALVAAQQLAFMGYYGDPRTAEGSGYVPFSQRAEYPAAMQRVATDRLGLAVRTPRELDAELVEADVVVVGSGAAGAVVAERLLERGRSVLILERGKHVDPSEFEEDELKQFSKLYADGAFQLSRDARFQVLQGRCVGGSTVVNNAVCFRLPDHALERWNDKSGLNAGLDEKALGRSFEELEGSLPVSRQPEDERLNPGARKFVDGVKALGLDRSPGRLEVVSANIEDCLGCGYCNYGCPYGKKLSMLDTVLPRAQARYGKDALRIFSECRVDRIERATSGVGDVLCDLPEGRRLQVRAKTVVLAAGAIASSLILQRSGLGGQKVGTGLGFNIAAPMHAEFEEKLDSYRGLQISHTLRPAGRGRPGHGDLVQPDRRRVALHARLVLRPLQKHAPLRPHGLRGRGRRYPAQRHGQARPARPRHETGLHPRAGRPQADGQGPPHGRPRVPGGRRHEGDDHHVSLHAVQERERPGRSRGVRPRQHRHRPAERASAGRECNEREFGQGRGQPRVPGPRRRGPLRVRRECVSLADHREPAAHGHGARPPRGRADLLTAAGRGGLEHRQGLLAEGDRTKGGRMPVARVQVHRVAVASGRQDRPTGCSESRLNVVTWIAFFSRER